MVPYSKYINQIPIQQYPKSFVTTVSKYSMYDTAVVPYRHLGLTRKVAFYVW